MDLDGEQLDVVERLVTSPVAGVFEPLEQALGELGAGDVVGHVRAGDALVAIRSAFRGLLVEVVAAPGQRVQPHERIAWLRTV